MLKIYGLTLAIVSLIALLFYGYDKKRAKKGKGRIPEFCLLTLAAIGGGVGAFLGMQIFRHKTNIRRKAHFVIGVPICALSQIALLVWLLL